MSIAMVFPGQGSQSQGMQADLADQFEAIRDTYAEASEILGYDQEPGLRYDRAAIASGEYFRLLSGHILHLGHMHFLLNVAGLALVWFLVGTAFSPSQWAAIIASNIIVIDLCFWFLMPGLGWYVGLSGLLHGMLAAGIAGIWRSRRAEALVIAAIVVLKLGYEILIGPVPGSGDMAGGDVITEAHLFGAIGGIIAGTLFSIRVQPEASI